MRKFLTALVALCWLGVHSQQNIVTYAGNDGKETFYDVLQLSDGTFVVCGYAENLAWIAGDVPQTELEGTTAIHNGLGTNRFAYILQFSSDLQTMLHVVKLPQGAAEDIRFMKTTNIPGSATGDLFISGNTSDTYDNDGGYFLAKLNNNFVNGIPTGLTWTRNVWAETGPKDYHPWDVTSDGEIYYISGHAHDYNWSAVYCLDIDGERKIVENWRTHWPISGSEWRGTPASAYPNGGSEALAYSGVVLKIWGRCELRSWTEEDYSLTQADGNGGTKMGKWPIDILFSGPCDPENPTADGPGYTGYAAESCCPVFGGSSIVVDRRNNHLYIGMNFKSNAVSPDFEPAVISMDETGQLNWWSRLYHEITPAGDTMISVPDQYVDALAIDYSLPASEGMLVVGARCHGNNTENLWEGNTVAANPAAHGFQNQFTGTQGDIHISWLGKLKLANGELMHSTYVAELSEGTGSLGTPHPDPNLDNWPDPNTGWPNVNTTRLAKNALRVTSDGWVCTAAVGRRTITTANAYQKMVNPANGGHSCWNNFIRVYDNDLSIPLYSSLVVGEWDTLTQAGGDNVDVYGIFKTEYGIVGVGRHKADDLGVASGVDLPVINVTNWGENASNGESAVLVYYVAENLYNEDDSPVTSVQTISDTQPGLFLSPNPATDELRVRCIENLDASELSICSSTGTLIKTGIRITNGKIVRVDLSGLPAGVYFVKSGKFCERFVKM